MYEGLTQRTTVQIGEILEPFGNINSRNEGLTEIPAENKNDLFSSHSSVEVRKNDRSTKVLSYLFIKYTYSYRRGNYTVQFAH